MKKSFLVGALLLAVSTAIFTVKGATGMTNKKHTVLVVLEAKPGQEKELEDALVAVMAPSRGEATNIEYRLHRDVNNPAQFFLYETWTSKEDHALQFEKPYIIDLGSKLEGFLAKPFQLIFGEEL